VRSPLFTFDIKCSNALLSLSFYCGMMTDERENDTEEPQEAYQIPPDNPIYLLIKKT
jgi:hypothetical protein